MPSHRQLSEEHGFALLEALVSAALLAVMLIAVMTTFDVTNTIAGKNKARATAASLAQQDQDRMRAQPIRVLSATAGVERTEDFQIDKVKYTVKSKAVWLNDNTQSTSCTATDAAQDYLEVTSTVSATVAGLKPVTVRSVISPPAGSFGAGQGSLAVKVLDASGGPQAGATVALTGTGSATRTTDSTGCAFFGYLATGAYTATVSGLGMVDPDGNPARTKAENVASQAVSTDSFQLDVAKTVRARFVTQKLDASGNLPTPGATGAYVASSARWVSFAHGSLTSTRKFGSASTAAATIDGTSLFPFTSPYAIFAGDCPGARPAATPALGARPEAPANRLASLQGTVDVLAPAISLTVTKDGTTPLKDAVVRLTAKATGCAGTFTLGGANAKTQDNGRVVDPGAPFGTYSWCVQGDLGDGQGTRFKNSTADIAHTSADGVKVANVSLAGAAIGTCP